MARPIIALLTDFGYRDYYVAAMKAVILGIVPDAALVDITHDVPPQDIAAAAFELAACYRDFPPKTVFLVVIDPGVGTERRAMAAASRDQFFVAPDNGVLTPVLEVQPVVVELREPRFARAPISHTFEGRDRFAPAAAWLARGVDLREFGPPLPRVVRLDWQSPDVRTDEITGLIIKADRFGNLVSNIDGPTLQRAAAGRVVAIEIGDRRVGPLVATYGEVSQGDVCALVGSSGYLEVAVNGGSAAARLQPGPAARIRVKMR